jgi:hypothetical protein
VPIASHTIKNRPGRSGFDSQQGQEIFLVSTASRPALMHTYLPIQWIAMTAYPEVKRPECEADHSPPSSAEVENGGATPPLPHTFSWRSA